MKYLELYKKWMKTGLPRGSGLCAEFRTYLGHACGDNSKEGWKFIEGKHDPFFFIMYNPSKQRSVNNNYWAGPSNGEFTPLRQNIVLFMAAMNNEL